MVLFVVINVRRIEDIFPYDTIRKGQRELIDFVYSIFYEGKIGLAYAPTGIGKTIAILVAYALLVDEKKQLIVLTRTKSQAKIYLRELLALKKRGARIPYLFLRSRQELCPLVRKGRLSKIPYSVFLKICEQLRASNRCIFYANSNEKGEFSELVMRIGEKLALAGVTSKKLLKIGLRYKICPYELARFLASKVRVIVGAYPYLINERVREVFIRGSNVDLENAWVVIDEAHNLPSAIIEQNSVRLASAILDRLISRLEKLSPKGTVSKIADLIEDVLNILKDLRSDVLNVLNLNLGDKEFPADFSGVVAGYDFRHLMKLLDLSEALADIDTRISSDLISIYRFLEHFIEVYDEDKYFSFVTRIRNHEYVIQSKPLDPAPIIQRLFDKVGAVIMISGTLYPLEYYKMVLGLTEEPYYSRTEAIVIESEFPRDAIRVLVDLELSSRYDLRTEPMFNLYAQRLLDIVGSLPKDMSMLIIFPSYSFMNLIIDKLRIFPRKALIETKETKVAEVIRFLTENPGGAIFGVAGGKLAEGIDYTVKGKTLVKVVVIAGLPFPEYNIYINQLMRYYTRKFTDEFYARFITIIAPMIRRVLQISGRLIRRESDRGIVIILDKRFTKYSKYFPKIPWQLYVPYRSEMQLKLIIRESLRRLGLE